MIRFVKEFIKDHKIVRGMLAYSILWPIGSMAQQTFVEGKNFSTYDYKKCAIFSAYGAFFVGPTLFCWMRVANTMWPTRTLSSALKKAFTEQIAYDPFAIAIFLHTMSLVEGKTQYQAKCEVYEKFLETYKVGFIYWPIIQTFNFTFVPQNNQVIVACFFSLLWTSFLAYMKHIEIHHLKAKKSRAKERGGFLSVFH